MSRPLSNRMRRQFEAAGCVFRMYDSGDGFPMEIGYARDGGYIAPTAYGGDNYRWLARWGIFDPQRARPEDNAVSVGKATRGPWAGTWCGWSHRAACAFGIGDMLFDPALLYTSHPEYEKWAHTPYAQVGTVIIETDEQAREAAARFAEYVS